MQQEGIFVVCDVETADEVNSYICSIGLAMVTNGQVKETTYSLINPECNFCERNTKIHGITKDIVADAPTFSEFWGKVGIVFEKAIIVAHNAPFDLSVIKKELIRNNINLDNIRYIDTLQIARKCLTLEHYCLSDVCKALDVNLENHHCALNDCLATAEVLINLLNKYDIDLESFVRKYAINKVENKRKNKSEIRIGVTLPSPYLEADFFSKCPNNINLQNIAVCLSGDFESMSKSEFTNLLEHRGVIVKKGVTKSIEYLIVGGQGSDQWAHGNYGSKIEKALDFNSKGSNILIVREREFLTFSNILD